MKKILQKTHEEETVENYSPRINLEDVKITTEKIEKPMIISELSPKKTTEKLVRNIERETITEKKGNKKIKKDFKPSYSKGSGFSPRKKFSGKKQYGNISYEPQKIELKKNGYDLVITEKPQAAMKIANALGKAVQKNLGGISYYDVNRGGKKLVVACAVGHLFTLKQTNGNSSTFPVFDIKWIPNYMAIKGDFTKKYYDVISKLAKEAGNITVATDFDVEGEVIGMNVVRYICGQKDANRMKFSTLTTKELNDAYEKKLKTLEWGQAIAGETRHYLDWFYGINLSRALMNAIKSTGSFKIMSIGRVQGPALNLVVQKEKEILAFKPEDFWQIFINVTDGKNNLELKYIEDIFEKQKLEKFEKINGKVGIAKTKKTVSEIPPNPPFNLTNLQTEAYSLYGLSPSKTLQLAQSLYLAGLISYPRTSSQKLPDSIDYKSILKILSKAFKTEKLTIKEKPVEGEKTDPAHPSIYPTGNSPGGLSEQEEKVYQLIVKRFLALFCENAIIDRKSVKVKVEDLDFEARGQQIRRKAWMEIYPSKSKEKEIPDMDGEVKITDSRIEQKQTQPPKRYSQASIISELEKRNLGTKATRASILETLYDRGYVREKSVEATPLGMSLIKTLETYSPIIIDEELTRNFETEMEEIQESKTKDLEKEEEKIKGQAKEAIIKIINDFKKNEKLVGEALIEATTEQRQQEREANKLTQCPLCKDGTLIILYSKKTRRQFVACDKYPECKNTYSLPPNGITKKSDKICNECGFPMVMRLAKGKRPWIFCFNKNCESNKKRLEEYRQKQQDEENNSSEETGEEGKGD